MKNITKIIIILAVVATIGFVGYAIGHKAQTQSTPTPAPLSSNVFTSNMFKVASTSRKVTVTSNTQLVGSSTPAYQRVYTAICNDSANKVYIGLDGDKPMTALTGIPLNANGGCLEINDQNMYTGAIRASSTNETSSDIEVLDFIN